MNPADAWLQTFSGKQIFPLDPKPDQICIEDIAHALSQICRFNGHTHSFYSVAEHSVFVALNVPVEHRVAALLHDASEAYLCDLPRPVKYNVVGYAEAEQRLMQAIADKFGFKLPLADCIKAADNRILLNEREQMLRPSDLEWGGFDDLEPLPGVQLRGWLPRAAEAAFLEVFYTLNEPVRVQ
jgi:hypothetical protein